jgi:hypothetical protein
VTSGTGALRAGVVQGQAPEGVWGSGGLPALSLSQLRFEQRTPPSHTVLERFI